MPTIQEQVALKIQGAGPKILETVIDQLADTELKKRIEIITTASNRYDNLLKEFKKINRPDIISYGPENAKIETTSETRFKLINKSKEKINLLEAALNNALQQNTPDTYTKLTETLNKVKDGGDNKPESTTETE